MSDLDDRWTRLVEAGRAKWMPGMKTNGDHRWLVRVPDWDDAATLGCLLGQVRDAWRWPRAFPCHDETGWCVPSGAVGCCVELQDEAGDGERYETEAEALIAALEAAP